MSQTLSCLRVSLFVLLLALFGCERRETAPNNSNATDTPGLIRIDIDKRDPEKLLTFYLNSFSMAGESALVKRGTIFYVDTSVVNRNVGQPLTDADSDGVIRWKELEPFLLSEYYSARAIPEELSKIREVIGDWRDPTLWFRVSVNGVMTAARRDIFVGKRNLVAAIRSFQNGDGLLYPDSTAFVAEHFDGSKRIETTLMVKRSDGLWDYAVFDADGVRADSTVALPRAYTVPTQCVGCHYGSRGFEPERSYPKPASKGPTGERTVHIPAARAESGLVGYFDEHMRRSDTILGLYATLYIADLNAQATDRLGADELALLRSVEYK